ncbi:MAG: hypothetical protein ACOYMQ_11120 [Pseudanabaena sp.]
MDPIFSILISSLIAALVSFFVTTYQTRNQVTQSFSIKLFEKRIDAYKELYRILSKFIKDIEFKKLADLNEPDLRGKLLKYLEEIEEWDSYNAIYMSDTPWIEGNEEFTTIAIAYNLRRNMYALLETSDVNRLKEACNSSRGLESEVLIDKIAALETALKREIGVYEIPLYPTMRGFRRISFSKAQASIIRRARKN